MLARIKISSSPCMYDGFGSSDRHEEYYEFIRIQSDFSHLKGKRFMVVTSIKDKCGAIKHPTEEKSLSDVTTMASSC
jgi:hypothetical protein